MATRRRRRSQSPEVQLPRVPAWILKLVSPLLPAALLYLWSEGAPPSYLAGISGAFLAYYWFLAPTTCGAPLVTEPRPCEENVNGVLRACHRQAHKARKRAQVWYSVGKLLGRRPPPPVSARPSSRTRSTAAPVTVSFSGVPPPPPPPDVGLGLDQRIGLAGLAISAASLVVSLLAWLVPRAAG
jgi:hypothetical protein